VVTARLLSSRSRAPDVDLRAMLSHAATINVPTDVSRIGARIRVDALRRDMAPIGAVAPSPPTDDYSDFGPCATIAEDNTGPDGTYTIVRPAMLGEDGLLHGPIIFGPGIGESVASMMGLLERIASHGFVIIGRQLDGGPGPPERNRRMIAGLDLLIEQDATAGSMFEGMLDVEQAVSMGDSVGGTGAVDIGGHEAIATVVSIHGHSADAELNGTLPLPGGTDDVMRNGQSAVGRPCCRCTAPRRLRMEDLGDNLRVVRARPALHCPQAGN
jgi:hypothetical protein